MCFLIKKAKTKRCKTELRIPPSKAFVPNVFSFCLLTDRINFKTLSKNDQKDSVFEEGKITFLLKQVWTLISNYLNLNLFYGQARAIQGRQEPSLQSSSLSTEVELQKQKKTRLSS